MKLIRRKNQLTKSWEWAVKQIDPILSNANNGDVYSYTYGVFKSKKAAIEFINNSILKRNIYDAIYDAKNLDDETVDITMAVDNIIQVLRMCDK